MHQGASRAMLLSVACPILVLASRRASSVAAMRLGNRNLGRSTLSLMYSDAGRHVPGMDPGSNLPIIAIPGMTDQAWATQAWHQFRGSNSTNGFLKSHKNESQIGRIFDFWINAEMLMHLASGTGANPGHTGSVVLDEDLIRRMHFQDKALLLLVFVTYAGCLIFSASLAYRQAFNNSPIDYYADPRFYTPAQAIESCDAEGFLDTFNTPPQVVHLHVYGLLPVSPLEEHVLDSAFEWGGPRQRVAFSFALDLSPWVVRGLDNPSTRSANPSGGNNAVGVSQQDVEHLQDFLDRNQNDLAYVCIHKNVVWPGWEELATNIKLKIRQRGFHGVVLVRRSDDEHMDIHMNRTWANFLHSRSLKILCAMSIVGWIVYQPYMWLKHRPLTIKSLFRVDLPISAYWPLIEDKLGPNGFDGEGTALH
mmetsp:Transcript_43444/g.86206  ORF Transcript_43444/g.86206 Transcript_43444/m.86206 type:complete len:421 (-) Transcript_43444:21-1283(-)